MLTTEKQSLIILSTDGYQDGGFFYAQFFADNNTNTLKFYSLCFLKLNRRDGY